MKRSRVLPKAFIARQKRRMTQIVKSDVLVTGVEDSIVAHHVFGDFFDFSIPNSKTVFNISTVCSRYRAYTYIQRRFSEKFHNKLSLLYGLSSKHPIRHVGDIFDRSNYIEFLFEIIVPHLIDFLPTTDLRRIVNVYGTKVRFCDMIDKVVSYESISARVSTTLSLPLSELAMYNKHSCIFKKLSKQICFDHHSFDTNIKHMKDIVKTNITDKETALNMFYDTFDIYTRNTPNFLKYEDKDYTITKAIVDLHLHISEKESLTKNIMREYEYYTHILGIDARQATEYIISKINKHI